MVVTRVVRKPARDLTLGHRVGLLKGVAAIGQNLVVYRHLPVLSAPVHRGGQHPLRVEVVVRDVASLAGVVLVQIERSLT